MCRKSMGAGSFSNKSLALTLEREWIALGSFDCHRAEQNTHQPLRSLPQKVRLTLEVDDALLVCEASSWKSVKIKTSSFDQT